MFNKLKDVEERYNFLTEEISKPEVIEDQETWKKLMKERADIEEIVNKYREFKQRSKIKTKKPSIQRFFCLSLFNVCL